MRGSCNKNLTPAKAHVHKWKNTSNSLSYVFQPLHVQNAEPHEPNGSQSMNGGHPFNGHPLCQLPWTIRFYFLSNILPLLSLQRNNFWHLQAISCQRTCHTSSLFAERLWNPGGCWEDGFQSPWTQTAAISHKLSWRKWLTTKAREMNGQDNFLSLSYDIQEAREKKKHSNENGLGNKKPEGAAGFQWDKITFVTSWVWGDWEALEIKD